MTPEQIGIAVLVLQIVIAVSQLIMGYLQHRTAVRVQELRDKVWRPGR